MAKGPPASDQSRTDQVLRPRYAPIRRPETRAPAAHSASASFQSWLTLALEHKAHSPRSDLLLGSLLLAMIPFDFNHIADRGLRMHHHNQHKKIRLAGVVTIAMLVG